MKKISLGQKIMLIGLGIILFFLLIELGLRVSGQILLLQQHIDKTMKMLKRKYPANLIKEYFQNHIKNLQFKI